MILVLLRHGKSAWNESGRFTGWTDIPIAEAGRVQAARAGEMLSAAGINFDEVHTSVLQRTRQTADSLLDAAHQPNIPRYTTWRLNERHYGQLQGKDKHEIFAIWGEAKFRLWWRGYFDPPPALDMDDPRHPHFDPLYATLPPEDLPRSESLQDCQHRLLLWWDENAIPALNAGRNLLAVSHGNTIRSLVMHLDNLDADEVEHVEIPSGIPLIYRFNRSMVVIDKEWLK
ncbi:MAG: 2,3-diphosphoglycerate-dependent phosphoglycerate mutase [Gallionella sp.]